MCIHIRFPTKTHDAPKSRLVGVAWGPKWSNSTWPLGHTGRMAYDATWKPPRPPISIPANAIIGHPNGVLFGLHGPPNPIDHFVPPRSDRWGWGAAAFR